LRELVDAFFDERTVATHHVDSYNDFLNNRLQGIINRISVGEGDPEPGIVDTDIEGYKVKLGSARIGHPIVKEADGSTRLLTPMEARLRNLSYDAPMYLEFVPVIEGVEHEPEEVRIGSMPAMVQSQICNIRKGNLEEHEGNELTDGEYKDRLRELQEDPLDPGGYFIVNGTERVLVSSEDLAQNRVLVEHNKRYGRQVPVAKVFSQREGYRALVIVEMQKDQTLNVSVPSSSGQVPLVVLLRGLGMESDEDIVNAIVTDDEMMPYVLANIEDSTEEHEVTDREEAMEFLGNRLAGGQAKEYRSRRVESMMDRNLLPHLGREPEARMKKAIYLGRMARSVLELELGRIEPDDKDHYANKRLQLAGDLMEDLFRVAFNGLAKDLKYQLERAHSRNRELKISTAVRSDVLTQRLTHALATGNWVGGRAGVAQLVDRTANLAAVSHVRRVVSPLSRSQPHFEARDLHPTHWGRLCPNETPEGPNCGLVKNMALMTEVSEGTEEDDIEEAVRELGVQDITARDFDMGGDDDA
jgi:DNA-directed RNA polymerase beta subunit